MTDTVTCTQDILIQFSQSLFIADTRLHQKLDRNSPMTTAEKSEKIEIIRSNRELPELAKTGEFQQTSVSILIADKRFPCRLPDHHICSISVTSASRCSSKLAEDRPNDH